MIIREVPVSYLVIILFLFTKSTQVFSNQTNDSTGVTKTKSFFDTLHVKAKNKKWTKELYNIVVVSPEKNKKKSVAQQITSSPYDIYNGMLIRKIEIKKIDIFGPEVYDTTLIAKNVFERTANNLHIKTANKIIKNHIILKPGHYFDSKELADNERILRNLTSINDVRILVSSHDKLNNTVDLTVIVKDVWSKGFGLETVDFKSGRFDFWDKNIFGTSHELNNIILWDNNYNGEKAGYEGMYRVKNMYGSFINTDFGFASAFDRREYSLNISRDFYTPQTKFAGGLAYNNSKYDQYIKNKFISDTFNLDFEFTDLWFARSFNINNKRFSDYRSNIILSASFSKYDYYTAPPTSENFLYKYQSRALILGAVSFSSQDFYKTNFIYSFGRTEDVPIGMLATLKFGFEKNGYKDRSYTEFTFKSGYYFPKAGYIFNRFDIGFFNRKDGSMEQGAFRAKLDYFTDIFNLGQFRYRQFVKLNYTNGFNRYIDEHVSINKNEGIRGFRTDSVQYNKKMVLNFESVLFTPLYFYGFRFVTYTFIDLAFTGPYQKTVFANKPYAGVGIGLRIRNDRLVFRTIQIQFGYYPGAPADMDRLTGSMSGEPRLRPENFYAKEPEIFIYK